MFCGWNGEPYATKPYELQQLQGQNYQNRVYTSCILYSCINHVAGDGFSPIMRNLLNPSTGVTYRYTTVHLVLLIKNIGSECGVFGDFLFVSSSGEGLGTFLGRSVGCGTVVMRGWRSYPTRVLVIVLKIEE